MPRQPRCYDQGEYFHVMVRGINKQDIFCDEEDRQRFVDTMCRFAKETEVGIVAWCLMSNHVHLLLKADRLPDRFMKKLGCSYAPYFNRKYGRVGHLFQDRYKSETIRDDTYLLAVTRYIHMNPQLARICRMDEYKWSSYNEYLTGGKTVCTEPVLELLGGPKGYVRFMEAADPDTYMDDRYNLTEQEAEARFSILFPGGAEHFQAMLPKERNHALERLSEAGLTPAQICRKTGIGKYIVYSVLKSEKRTVPNSGS